MPKKLPTKDREVKKGGGTIRAIRRGPADSLFEEPKDHRRHPLGEADLPYEVLVERMQQGVAMVNEQGSIVYCNPSLAELLEVSPAEVVGARLQDFLDPGDRTLGERLLAETRREPRGGEVRLRRPDGSLIEAHLEFRLLSRSRGKSAFGVLITDLTAQKQRAELATRLQRMQDEERRRIARDLHDSVGQLLVAIAINLSAVKKEAHKLGPETSRGVDDNLEMVDEIGKEIRTISHLLHPPLLDEVGLPSAIRWYVDGFAQRSNIQATVNLPESMSRLPRDMEIGIFRAIQECLTNIHRHSGSSTCAITITQDEHGLRVEVRDSGCGIAKEKQTDMQASGGIGIRALQQRIGLLGGSLQINSNEKGTTVVARLPLPGPQAAPPPKEHVA